HDDAFQGNDIQNLSKFLVVQRRFKDNKVGNQLVIDDYAHHRIDITATIDSARNKYPGKKVVAIFQPHTFTRTNTFLQDFADSLNLADDVYLCDIFGSLREDNGNLTINDLQHLVEGSSILDISQTDVLRRYEDSVLIFMGAG